MNIARLTHQLGKQNLVLPGKIIKRDGSQVSFDMGRIEKALEGCYENLQDRGIIPTNPVRVITDSCAVAIASRYGRNEILPSVERIQDLVEITLLTHNEVDAARAYMSYRDTHAKLRGEPIPDHVREAFEIDAEYFPTPMQRFAFYDKYSRFNWDLGRRETWPETVDRTIDHLKWEVYYHAVQSKAKTSSGVFTGYKGINAIDLTTDQYAEFAAMPISDEIWERLRKGILEMKVMPSMRLLAMAGAAARRNSISSYNCSYLPISDINAFVEILICSMSGSGVGYSVEKHNIEQFPRVMRQDGSVPEIFIIEDSSDGWAEALRSGLKSWWAGKDLTFDFSLIRPAGSVLKTKGGRASGPEPLIAMLKNIRTIILSRQGSFISTKDAHYVACNVGEAAVQGGVRRTAMIALFDWDDQEMRSAKSFDFWNDSFHKVLGNANNSAVWPDNISDLSIMRQMTEMMFACSGEPGIFSRASANKTIPEARRNEEILWGVNPCQPASAPVLTSSGLSTMGQIAEGDVIWSEDGWVTVDRKWSTGVKPVFRYRTTSGYVEATENHRIVQRGKKIELADAESIDTLSAPNFDIPEISPQAILDGLFVGDGFWHNASSNAPFLCIGQDDQDYFDSEISQFIGTRMGSEGFKWRVSTSLSFEEVTTRTFDREIPERYLFGSVTELASFLRGLYSANGSMVGKRQTLKGWVKARVTLKTASPKLRDSIQLALSVLGIKSYYTTNAPSLIEWENGAYESRESYDINIATYAGIKRFSELVGFVQRYKTELLTAIVEAPVAYSNYRASKDIVSVEPVGNLEVFDITVSGVSHTYWHRGFNVSNCGEIILRPFEMCNLSQAISRSGDAEEDLAEKVELATILGTIQSLSTRFPGLRAEWKKNCEEERLLGVDLTAQNDCELLWISNPDGALLRQRLKAHAIAINEQYANILGIKPSASITCNKPAGNSTGFIGAGGSGISRAFAQFYVRRNTVWAHTPQFRVLRESGVPMRPYAGYTEENAEMWWAEFPIRCPDGVPLARDASAIEQCEFWLLNKLNWTTHNPSNTINYRVHEMVDLIKWVCEHKDVIGGLSFLPISDMIYPIMPMEEITEAEYNRRMAAFPEVDYSLLYQYERSDMSDASTTLSCFAGNCEL